MNSKMTKVYVCTGTCHAEISEERYKNGLIKCGTEGCTMYGKHFEERIKKINNDREKKIN